MRGERFSIIPQKAVTAVMKTRKAARLPWAGTVKNSGLQVSGVGIGRVALVARWWKEAGWYYLQSEPV